MESSDKKDLLAAQSEDGLSPIDVFEENVYSPTDTGVNAGITEGGRAGKTNLMGWVKFAFLVFNYTSAGPFGIESAVKAGGPLVAMILIFAIPLIHVAPIVLTSSELSSWMPTNHGTIKWIDRSFGHFVGFINANMSIVVNVVDLSIYPVLAVNYLAKQFFPDAGFWVHYGCRVAIVAVGSIPGFMNMDDIGIISGITMGLIMLPFVIGVGKGIATVDTSTLGNINSDVNIAETLSVGIWMYTGFLSIAAFGGELKTNSTMPKACFMSMTWGILMYLLPLIVALQVPGNWDDGFLVTAFDTIMPGLGIGVSLAGALSGFGLYFTSLAGCARQMWAVADIGWLPAIFTRINVKTACPIPALIFQIVAVVGLVAFDFKFLVMMEMVVSTASYLLYFLCFVTLRYQEPFAPRPFMIPGGKIVAWIVIAPVFIIFCTMFATALAEDWRIDVGVFLAILFVASVYIWFIRKLERGKRRHAAENAAYEKAEFEVAARRAETMPVVSKSAKSQQYTSNDSRADDSSTTNGKKNGRRKGANSADPQEADSNGKSESGYQRLRVETM